MDERVAKETGADQRKGKVVVGITGASGTVYGLRTVKALLDLGYHPEVILTEAAIKVSAEELGEDLRKLLEGLVERVYMEDEIDAPASSSSTLAGSLGIAVVPCSIRTLAEVASGIASNLVTRAVINHLRLRKRVVLVIRETPLGVIELRNALKVATAGAIILPASPGFYTKPKTIDDIISFVVGKTLDALEIQHDLYPRWTK
ncbi:MAG: UbiX family flavin prenyltransferase [Metallosphaera yellowstonensis]|jgi:4-hydroxy-3-polyprenylbenzoate decarboxylase|uniref:Flavin prenyltransferase UbiX n=1 Tax=Metallosphaera yellowstonensis MK1 TaxID=671065 RepID=H2C718_9CREN|nr:UbiX family flavin prenyltransferase [Metallosphaera yellowstonensis]EHP69595.1 polyprenyl p-hydroxybenzoate/phenylacrylic acid decarboxylase [Metallosphaera yellowstonensis MK1]